MIHSRIGHGVDHHVHERRRASRDRGNGIHARFGHLGGESGRIQYLFRLFLLLFRETLLEGVSHGPLRYGAAVVRHHAHDRDPGGFQARYGSPGGHAYHHGGFQISPVFRDLGQNAVDVFRFDRDDDRSRPEIPYHLRRIRICSDAVFRRYAGARLLRRGAGGYSVCIENIVVDKPSDHGSGHLSGADESDRIFHKR